MMSELTWLVVADGGRARIFQVAGQTGALTEIHDLASAVDRDSLTEKDREKFSEEVAKYLEAGRLHSLYSTLIFAIESKFLGMLKTRLDKETLRLIVEQISEDISMLDTRGIEAHLKR
jgi:protein required for attachment to host cells